MLNFGELVHTIQNNCHISDARHAGSYSMCIFLLKMREYYRWENEIPLSQQLGKADVGAWLLEREQTWEKYEDASYAPLPLASGAVDPFEAATINRELVPQGYVYSSGYGLYQKPHFFLGQLKKKIHKDGVTIYVSSCEYARDLVAPPAMTIGDTIFIRQESLRRFIWEKIEEWQWKRDEHTPMARALAFYAHEQDMERILDHMCDDESNNLLLHEIGETEAGKQLGGQWEEMLAQIPRSQTEMQIRAVRDHLADCLSTLPNLLEEENSPALHFYFANFTAMRKQLFPAALNAYEKWVSSGETKQLVRTIEAGKQHWLDTGQRLLESWRKRGADDTKHFDQVISAL
jgi:hypothetical protein